MKKIKTSLLMLAVVLAVSAAPGVAEAQWLWPFQAFWKYKKAYDYADRVGCTSTKHGYAGYRKYWDTGCAFRAWWEGRR